MRNQPFSAESLRRRSFKPPSQACFFFSIRSFSIQCSLSIKPQNEVEFQNMTPSIQSREQAPAIQSREQASPIIAALQTPADEQFVLDEALLQSISERIAALFPRCSAQTNALCHCISCRPIMTTVSNIDGVDLPPPSRYVRRIGPGSRPPNGPAVQNSNSRRSIGEAAACKGPIEV